MTFAAVNYRPTAQSVAAAQVAAAVELRGVTKSHRRGDQRMPILSGVDLAIRRGDYQALMGPSGSGKSTLLNLIAGLDRPDTGSVCVAGHDLASLSEDDLTQLRGRAVGFIHQSFNLMPVLTARENVELPLLLTKLSKSQRRERSDEALRVVGLADRANHYPRQLSGGQEQRVAVARAIVHDPEILVADEPTGNLDRSSADELLALFATLNSSLGKTIVMVTHDPAAARQARVIRHLEKGVLR